MRVFDVERQADGLKNTLLELVLVLLEPVDDLHCGVLLPLLHFLESLCPDAVDLPQLSLSSPGQSNNVITRITLQRHSKEGGRRRDACITNTSH